MENLVLIDGNSLINRAFYAMPILSTKDGVYTNAVYGFMNMLFKIIGEVKPKYLGVAFDLKAPTFRHKLFSDYKGTRKPMPEELRPQIPLLKDLLKEMNIAVLSKEGFEADDIIGTIAKNTDIKTLIFTGDKDSFQLVDEQTEVHFTRRGITDTEVYTLENFTEKTSLVPSQIIDLKALMGDSSDNIPGINGVGEKTALSLLEKYKNIETLYENANELTGKLAEKVNSSKEICFLSKTLATIDVNAPIDYSLDDLTFNFPFNGKVKERFIKLELKSLYQREGLFDSEKFLPKALSIEAPLTKVKALSEVPLDKFLDECALTIEISSVNIFANSVGEYSFTINQTLLDDGFSLKEILEYISPVLSKTKKLIVYDKKELRHLLAKLTTDTLTSFTEDVSLMNYLGDFTGGAEKLEEVISKFGFSSSTPATSLYNAYTKLYEILSTEETLSLYQKVELPLSDVLYQMEVSGFKVDGDALFKTGENYKSELIKLENQIREIAGDNSLNVNSPKQLGELLFNKLKVGKAKKTKTGFSTSAEVLENLENAHPIIPLILSYRKIQKLLSTYIEGFKPLIEKPSGLIHTSFNQTVTATGRLSSKEPNLQNIPVRDELSKELRKFFVPKSEDRILISADYSQIELRLLAGFSGTPSLVKAFNENEDIHVKTASEVFDKPVSEVSAIERFRAKAVNFGIIYGISEYGLAKQLKIAPAVAKNYIENYFRAYPEVKEYMQANVEFAKNTGYAKTVLGRRRYIKELSSPNFMTRSFGERASMNMPLQGSSADIIKLAMINVSNRLKKENLKSELILQIHDELIIDAFISEQEKVQKLLKEEMENAIKLCVPLTVSLGSGKTWFDAK